MNQPGLQSEPKAERRIQFCQIGFAQLAELFPDQISRRRSYRAFCERRMNQPRLAPELKSELARAQPIAHRSHRHHEQIIRRIIRADTTAGRIFAED